MALIGEKSIHRLFLNSPIEYPLALEPVYVRSKKAPLRTTQVATPPDHNTTRHIQAADHCGILCVCWLFDLFIYLLVELFDG